jgi:hypothetical protein
MNNYPETDGRVLGLCLNAIRARNLYLKAFRQQQDLMTWVTELEASIIEARERKKPKKEIDRLVADLDYRQITCDIKEIEVAKLHTAWVSEVAKFEAGTDHLFPNRQLRDIQSLMACAYSINSGFTPSVLTKENN